MPSRKGGIHFVLIHIPQLLCVFSYGLTTLADIEADPLFPSASVAVAVIT